MSVYSVVYIQTVGLCLKPICNRLLLMVGVILSQAPRNDMLFAIWDSGKAVGNQTYVLERTSSNATVVRVSV